MAKAHKDIGMEREGRNEREHIKSLEIMSFVDIAFFKIKKTCALFLQYPEDLSWKTLLGSVVP